MEEKMDFPWQALKKAHSNVIDGTAAIALLAAIASTAVTMAYTKSLLSPTIFFVCLAAIAAPVAVVWLWLNNEARRLNAFIEFKEYRLHDGRTGKFLGIDGSEVTFQMSDGKKKTFNLYEGCRRIDNETYALLQKIGNDILEIDDHIRSVDKFNDDNIVLLMGALLFGVFATIIQFGSFEKLSEAPELIQYVFPYAPIAFFALAAALAVIFLINLLRFKTKGSAAFIGETVMINGKKFIVKNFSMISGEVRLIDSQLNTVRIRRLDLMKAEQLISI